MAGKLIKAKEVALGIDPDYYRALWVNSHEACPDWMPPPDEAATDSYLGNGFFPTWCLEVVAPPARSGGPRRPICIWRDDLDRVAAAGEFRGNQCRFARSCTWMTMATAAAIGR